MDEFSNEWDSEKIFQVFRVNLHFAGSFSRIPPCPRSTGTGEGEAAGSRGGSGRAGAAGRGGWLEDPLKQTIRRSWRKTWNWNSHVLESA